MPGETTSDEGVGHFWDAFHYRQRIRRVSEQASPALRHSQSRQTGEEPWQDALDGFLHNAGRLAFPHTDPLAWINRAVAADHDGAIRSLPPVLPGNHIRRHTRGEDRCYRCIGYLSFAQSTSKLV
jgi:hypothetical protein